MAGNGNDTAYCNACSQDLPVTQFYRYADGGLKAQCKACRCASEKVRLARNKALNEGRTPPERSPRRSSRPVGTQLNDYVCPLGCGLQLKRQNQDLHKEHVCHSTNEPRKKCSTCEFETDCFGHLAWHAQRVHGTEMALPHKNTRLFTCASHANEIRRAKINACYRTDEQRAKARKRYAESTPEQRIGKRQATVVRDATEERQAYAAQLPPTSASSEQEPLRQHQKRVYEKTVGIRNMRRQWRKDNFLAVREMWRRHHAKYRTARNEASAQYKVKNVDFKLTQVKHQASIRNLSFSIGQDVAEAYMQQNCFYCNTEAEECSKTGLCGLDRVNSQAGYEGGNCVPCCPACNVMKGALSVHKFLEQVERIYRKLALDSPDADIQKQETDEFEDVLKWDKRSSLEKINTNVQIMQELLDSNIPLTALANNKDKIKFVAFLQEIQHKAADIADIPDNEDELEKSNPLLAFKDDPSFSSLMQEVSDNITAYAEHYRDIKAKAKTKEYMVKWAGKHAWRLTNEQAVSLIYKNECAYCDAAGDIGIDRLDSSGCYEIGNVVSCCGRCNIMKSCFSVPKFLTQVRRICETFELTVPAVKCDVNKALRKRAHVMRVSLLLPSTPAENPQQTQTAQAVKTAAKKSTRGRVDTCSTSLGWTKSMRVGAIAMMTLHARADVMKYHTRMCGRTDDHNWRIVQVQRVKEMFPEVKPCGICVSDSAIVADCERKLLESDVPHLEPDNYFQLLKDEMKPKLTSNWLLTDMCSNVFHSCCHGTVHRFDLAIFPTSLALSVNPQLKPCKRCVTTDVEAPEFDGILSGKCQITDPEQVKAFYEKAITEKRREGAQRKAKCLNKVKEVCKKIVEYAIVQKNSAIMHTRVHCGSKHGAMVVAVSERQLAAAKFCKTCVDQDSGVPLTREEAHAEVE